MCVILYVLKYSLPDIMAAYTIWNIFFILIDFFKISISTIDTSLARNPDIEVVEY
jgi:hypothetical protein